MHDLLSEHRSSRIVRLVTDGSGNVISRHDYLPFGEEITGGYAGRTSALGFAASEGVPQRFTGKERDSESGLDYFGARYYGSALGRFSSPDPIGGHYTDPQTLNKYAYVRNNPLRYVDPDGLDLKASCDEESDTCHKAHWWSGRYEGTWDQDHEHFTVTNFQTDSSGNSAGHTINFDASGIHIDGHQGSFIAGTDATRVNGTGDFSGTHFVANSDCLGTCVAGGGLFNNDGGGFLGVAAFGLQGPNLGIDRFGEHPGDQYRGGNTNGPDAHLSFVPGDTELPLHFDTRFPYGSISGFAVHTGDLFYHDFQTGVLRRQDAQSPNDIKPAQSVPQP